MPNTGPKIREIKRKDNEEIARVIRSVLVEYGVPKVGTAYEDKSLDCMFETYNNPNATYFVVEENDNIIGTAGVGPLEGEVCELQKMYFLPVARSRGLGAKMMDICLKQAKHLGYRKVYIETMPNMKAAQKLYVRSGFEFIDKPMGNTGHHSCPIYLLKSL